MDLHAVINELHGEKERLDRVIAALESLSRSAIPAGGAAVEEQSPTKRRRGRLSMSSEEREYLSGRMKAYWAAKRSRQLIVPAVPTCKADQGAEGAAG